VQGLDHDGGLFDGGDVAERMSGFWWESADRPTAATLL
jgi:hypothetical protein